MIGDQKTVLVVDDDPACRDLHALWLGDEYDVLTAANGNEALDDVAKADVVVLDREMPRMDGGTLARHIRESRYDCFVVILSGVEPDFDLVDLPIDHYLTKPVDREEVLAVVEQMLTREICQRLLQEYFSLTARKKSLDRRKRPAELAESDAYRRLVADLSARRVAVRELLEEINGPWGEAMLTTISEDTSVESFARS